MYNFPFTRIKNVEAELDAASADTGGDEEAKTEEVKTEEVKTEEVKEPEEEKKTSPVDDLMNKLKQKPKTIDLESIEEGEVGESNQ